MNSQKADSFDRDTMLLFVSSALQFELGYDPTREKPLKEMSLGELAHLCMRDLYPTRPLVISDDPVIDLWLKKLIPRVPTTAVAPTPAQAQVPPHSSVDPPSPESPSDIENEADIIDLGDFS
jgi:hypothetical protein